MAAAAAAAIATSKLVLTVGSFRDRDQRTRFRDIARSAGASVTTLRICCPIDTATKRIRSRIASGERGPTEKAIQLIDAELNRASDIDVVLANDTSIEHFYRQADNIMEFLVWGSDVDPPAAAAFVERFEEFAAFEFAVTRKLIEPKRSRMAPGTRNEIASGIEQELQRFRVRIRELRNCLLLVLPRPIESNIETTLQEATDKWVKAVDRLGAIA
jgi:hypothetical protein